VNRVAIKTGVNVLKNNYWAMRNTAGIGFPSSLVISYKTVNIRDFKS
jgi:hypothetical protein